MESQSVPYTIEIQKRDQDDTETPEAKGTALYLVSNPEAETNSN